MATTFDEILLDTFYSAIADGGPEFATAIVNAGDGGNISFRNSNREDYISRYEIDFAEIESVRRKFLRKFSILRQGMARGFRFLAPDDDTLERENLGWLNPATGEVEYLAQTDGVLTDYYLIKHYSDPGNYYTRRIVKPSPYENVLIEVFPIGDLSTPVYELTINAGAAISGDVINATVAGELDPGYPFTFNFHTGKLTFTVAPYPPDNVIKVSCTYHLPVTFEDDWQRFQVDEGGISAFKVRLRELLPVELGIV